MAHELEILPKPSPQFMRLFLPCSLLAAWLAVPGFASELFYTTDHDGSLMRLDTKSLVHERVAWGHEIPNATSAGPGGLAFVTRDQFLISADGPSNSYDALHRYRYTGGAIQHLSTRRTADKMWRLTGAVRTAGGRVRMPSLYGHSLWSFGGDLYLPDSKGIQRNTGPAPTNEAATGQYPRHIAYSWSDGRMAVSHQNGIQIFSTASGTPVLERDIPASSLNSIAGLAFDHLGVAVLDESGSETGRRSVLWVSTRSFSSETENRLLRYDATTGEPLGSNPEDPGDPTFLSSADGGFMEMGQIGVDPADGRIYVNNKSRHFRDQWNNPGVWVLSRFNRFGVLEEPGFVKNIRIRHLTFRPTLRQLEIESDTGQVLDAATFAATGASSGVWFKTALGINQAIADYFGPGTFAGELTVGGEGSGRLTFQLRNGTTLKTVALAVDANGVVRVIEQSTVDVEGGARISGGTLEAAEGTLNLQPGADLGAAALIDNGGSLIGHAGGNIIGHAGGNIIAAGGGNLIGHAGGNNIATGGGNIIAAGGGNIIAAGGGNLQAGARTAKDVSPADAGEVAMIQAVGGEVIAEDGGVLTCGAAGLIEASKIRIERGGTLTTGLDYAIAKVHGSLQTDEGSIIRLKLGGSIAGEEHDAIRLETGGAILDGTIEIVLDPTFATTLDSSDSFTVLTSTSPIGGASVGSETRVMTSGGTGSFRATLAPDSLSLTLDDYQAASALEQWEWEHFAAAERLDPEISGSLVDPDGDGLANWAEFAFHSDPKAAGPPPLEVMAAGPETAELRYRRRTGGTGTAASYAVPEVRYQLQISSDLVLWSNVESAGETPAKLTPSADGITEEVIVTLARPAAGEPRFYRLEVKPTAE